MNENGFFRRALPWILGALAGCAFAAGVVCCIGMLLRRSKMRKECEPEILPDGLSETDGEYPDGLKGNGGAERERDGGADGMTF